MLKSHMQSPVSSSNRTRCGQPTDKPHIKRIYAFEYGSPKATCKMCHRLHAGDIAKGNCTKCRFSDPDHDYVCSIRHAQIYTTNNGQTVRIGYFAHGSACPDFVLSDTSNDSDNDTKDLDNDIMDSDNDTKDSSDSVKISELDMRKRGAFRELLRGDDQ